MKCDARNKRRYVWHKGRVWINSGLRDHRGWLELVRISDRHQGITAPPEEVHPVTDKQLEACKAAWGSPS